MDALLMALLGALLAETGGPLQRLTLALTVRYERRAAVLGGMLLAVTLVSALAALLGSWVAPLLTPNPRLLLLAMALAATGGGMLLPVREPDSLACWKIGAFWTSMLGLFILAAGDGSQFLVLAISAKTGDMLLTTIGSTLGLAAACVPVVMLGRQFFDALPLRLVRRVGGGLLLLLAGSLAVQALQLA
jgi:putative Ca2+/H+ antiporter (TMEM165/GDT1 family)